MYEPRVSHKAFWGSIPNENFPVQIYGFITGMLVGDSR